MAGLLAVFAESERESYVNACARVSPCKSARQAIRSASIGLSKYWEVRKFGQGFNKSKIAKQLDNPSHPFDAYWRRKKSRFSQVKWWRSAVRSRDPHHPRQFLAHKTKAGQDSLEAHPHVRLHFTPTYSSRLNQVDIWFAKIERDMIARGVFTSVPDLAPSSAATSMLIQPTPSPFAENTPRSPVVFVVTMLLVAVGTTLADRPPHRSVRALLTHTAPTSDAWRQNESSGKDARCVDKEPSGRTPSGSDPSASASCCGDQLLSTTTRTVDAGTARASRCCRVPRGIGNNRVAHFRATHRPAPAAHASGVATPASTAAVSRASVCPPSYAKR